MDASRKGGIALLPRTNNAEGFSQVVPEADPPGRRIQISLFACHVGKTTGMADKIIYFHGSVAWCQAWAIVVSSRDFSYHFFKRLSESWLRNDLRVAQGC